MFEDAVQGSWQFSWTQSALFAWACGSSGQDIASLYLPSLLLALYHDEDMLTQYHVKMASFAN